MTVSSATPSCFERFEQPRDVGVDLRAHGVVESDVLVEIVAVAAVVRVVVGRPGARGAPRAGEGGGVAAVGAAGDRPAGVHLRVFLAGLFGVVGGLVGQRHHPGLSLAGHLADLLDGDIGRGVGAVLVVVLDVLSAVREDDVLLEPVVALVAAESLEAALEAFADGAVAVAAEVPLAHEARLVSAGVEGVGERGRVGRQGPAVVDHAASRAVLAGHQRAAEGPADRVVGVGPAEQHAPAGDAVERRRDDVRVVHAAQGVSLLLIGEYQKNVHGMGMIMHSAPAAKAQISFRPLEAPSGLDGLKYCMILSLSPVARERRGEDRRQERDKDGP